MTPNVRGAAAATALLIAMSVSGTSFAQKPGGVLKMYIWDNPRSMPMLEGANPIGQQATMGVFNNLIMFDQQVRQSSLESIVPDLGKPFTAADVKCTWDLLLEKSSDKLRVNPIKSWYRNLEEVTANGDYEVTFRLKRPQPAFLMPLADGFAPVYPCHVFGRPDAPASDPHRPVQIRRVQTERGD